jgi:hypothetical protein
VRECGSERRGPARRAIRGRRSDAFPLIRGQALMYRAAMIATWFVKLSEKVDVEWWIKVWNTVFENESVSTRPVYTRL